MKKLFKAIKQNNFEEVKHIIESHNDNPELVNCISKAPPKMDEGQSALQVAIKNGGGWHDTRIIAYLLDKGADVNFREDDRGLELNEIACWPVLMDMVQAVYMNATQLSFKYHPEETKGKAAEFIAVLERMLELGADPNKTDNRMHTVWSAVLGQYESHYIRDDDTRADYNAFLGDITRRLMDLMIAHGANIYRRYSSYPKDDPRYEKAYHFDLLIQVLTNNLVFNRELTYGLSGSESAVSVRSKSKWIDLMKPYYEKDNPYYGAVVSKEREQFFQELERIRDEEEKDLIL